MAQENLINECKKRGFNVKVETQGSLGIENELTQEEIQNADLVILGISIAIEGEERFDGKIVYRTEVSPLVKRPSDVVDKALEYFELNK